MVLQQAPEMLMKNADSIYIMVSCLPCFRDPLHVTDAHGTSKVLRQGSRNDGYSGNGRQSQLCRHSDHFKLYMMDTGVALSVEHASSLHKQEVTEVHRIL